MTTHERKRYTCYLPVEETKTMKSVVPQNATNGIIESERKVKAKKPDELLEILKDQCFYRHEGWWSYEFWYYGKIRQVHIEGYPRICSRLNSMLMQLMLAMKIAPLSLLMKIT